MIIECKLDENDYLTHQLFNASKSERINKKRKRNKVITALIYVACGLLMFLIDNYFMAIGFVAIGVLWYVLYPLWERRHYVKHYKSFIKENYKNQFNKVGTLEFKDDFVLAKDSGTESKILITELEAMFEIPSTIFVKLKGGQSFVLPKDKIGNIANVVIRLKEIAQQLNIEYNIDENWEWK